ncbi:MAG: pilus assembly PilX N-terminal domain-containing protein [Patescibacteria group bacterium]
MTTISKSSAKQRNGFVLISSIVVIILLMLLGVYFLNFTLTEYRIAKSQTVGIQDYYLAEAGIHEMIWRLKHDTDWRNSFETNPTWSTQFTQDNALLEGGSYTVTIQNTDQAQGEVTSTGTMVVGGQTSQRIIKTTIYKAIGENPTADLAIYDNGNIDFDDSIVNVYNGGLFSNNNVLIKGDSEVDVQKKIQAVNQINISWTADVTAEAYESANYPPAPDSVIQPAIDFDSEDPTSYKNQAIAENHLYTESEFATFLANNPSTTLDGIYYVTGRVDIKRGMDITINGILASDGSIEVGTKQNPKTEPFAKLTVNHTEDVPSGILCKNKIDFGAYTQAITIQGLLYSLQQIDMVSLPSQFDLVGGFYSRKLHTISLWNVLNITYDEETVNTTIGSPSFSPTIYVEHWEEEY